LSALLATIAWDVIETIKAYQDRALDFWRETVAIKGEGMGSHNREIVVLQTEY
jgi:hypothetical protein